MHNDQRRILQVQRLAVTVNCILNCISREPLLPTRTQEPRRIPVLVEWNRLIDLILNDEVDDRTQRKIADDRLDECFVGCMEQEREHRAVVQLPWLLVEEVFWDILLCL